MLHGRETPPLLAAEVCGITRILVSMCSCVCVCYACLLCVLPNGPAAVAVGVRFLHAVWVGMACLLRRAGSIECASCSGVMRAAGRAGGAGGRLGAKGRGGK